MQDITSIKPRQKNLAKKVLKKKEITSKDVRDSGLEDRTGEPAEDEKRGAEYEEEYEDYEEEGGVKRTQRRPVFAGVAPQDVPDGAQISKAFDTLCNIVRDRMRKYKSRPEPIADFYTKGRYVLVSGDGSYLDPCFYTSTPSAGHVYVTIRDDPYGPSTPIAPPMPPPMPTPTPMPPGPGPLDPTPPSDGEGGRGKGDKGGGKGKDGGGGGGGGKGKHRNGDPHPRPKDPSPTPQPQTAPAPGPPPTPSHHGASGRTPDCMSYEKLEVVESVEKFSNDRKMKGYEETAMVVETMIEKTSKKKH